MSNPVKEYGWRMKVEGDADWSDWTYVSGTTTSTTVDDLENGTAHTFQVIGREHSVMVGGVLDGRPVLRHSHESEPVTVTPKAADE